MKKALVLLMMIMSMLLVVGCGEDHEGMVKTPSGSDILKGQNYVHIQKQFEEDGFTNVKTEPIDDLITGWLTEDGEVEKVTIDGDPEYSPDKWVPEDVEVIIYYHTFPSDDEDKSDKNDGTKNSNKSSGTITIKNNSDFKKLMNTADPEEDSLIDFSDKYANEKIEFDGCVMYQEDGLSNLLIWYGDFKSENETSHYGPEISLQNVSGSFKIGDNVHIVAELIPYVDKSYMYKMDCVSIKTR